MTLFRFHLKSGEVLIGEGETAAEALNKLGWGNQAVSTLDGYESINQTELGLKFFTMQVSLNQGRGVEAVREIARLLHEGNFGKAKATVFNEADKIVSYPEVRAFIAQELFGSNEKLPWVSQKKQSVKLRKTVLGWE